MRNQKVKSKIPDYNYFPKNRKGSHVGFVVSFVIFITFLVFLYAVLQPTITRDRSKSYVLDYLSFNLINSSTSETTSLTIKVEENTETKSCLNMQQFQEIPEEMKPHLRIENSSGDLLPYYPKNVNTLYIYTGTNFIGLLDVYYSEEIIGEIDSSLKACDPKAYSMGIIKTYKEIFESNLIELNASYYADYEGLKIDLGIPEGTEFSFSLLDGNRVEIFKAEIEPPPETRSVYVEEAPIQYLGENGETKFGFLVIKVW